MKHVYRVKAVWDPDAEVFLSVSDIDGFHIEASDLEEFEAVMMDVAPELIVLHHRTATGNDVCSSEESLPVILWQQLEIKKAGA